MEITCHFLETKSSYNIFYIVHLQQYHKKTQSSEKNMHKNSEDFLNKFFLC